MWGQLKEPSRVRARRPFLDQSLFVRTPNYPIHEISAEVVSGGLLGRTHRHTRIRVEQFNDQIGHGLKLDSSAVKRRTLERTLRRTLRRTRKRSKERTLERPDETAIITALVAAVRADWR